MIPTELPPSDGPLVSVIIPTYRDGEYLPDALESVADQTYTNLEAIVIDSSGDPDVHKLVTRLEWAEYHYQTPQGPGAARNHGIHHASGEYIAFLDADDMWAMDKLQRQVTTAEVDDVDFVYSDQYITELEP